MYKITLVFLSLIATGPMYCMAKLARPFARFAHHKRPALLLGSTLGLSSLLVKATETKPKEKEKVAVVPNSVYAEIRGFTGRQPTGKTYIKARWRSAPTGKCRIYKGKEQTRYCSFSQPKLYFFTEEGQELLHEEFPENQFKAEGQAQEWRAFDHKMTEKVQTRLAEYPVAHKAFLETRHIKGCTSVYLQDKNGNTIASTYVNSSLRDAKPTDKLDLLTIYKLKKQIKNHDFLENLTFKHIQINKPSFMERLAWKLITK